MELWYWHSQGFAQPIRYMLKAKKINFTEKLYTKDTIAEWHSQDKIEMAKYNNFPNLPLLKIEGAGVNGGPKVICQSRAVLSHVAELCGFAPETADEKIHCETLAGVFSDLFMKLFTKIAAPNVETYPENKQQLEKDLLVFVGQVCKQLETLKFLASNERLTFVDFMWFQMFNFLTRWSKAIGENKTVVGFMENVRAAAGESFVEYDRWTNGNILFVPPGMTAVGGCVLDEVQADV